METREGKEARRESDTEKENQEGGSAGTKRRKKNNNTEIKTWRRVESREGQNADIIETRGTSGREEEATASKKLMGKI